MIFSKGRDGSPSSGVLGTWMKPTWSPFRNRRGAAYRGCRCTHRRLPNWTPRRESPDPEWPGPSASREPWQSRPPGHPPPQILPWAGCRHCQGSGHPGCSQRSAPGSPHPVHRPVRCTESHPAPKPLPLPEPFLRPYQTPLAGKAFSDSILPPAPAAPPPPSRKDFSGSFQRAQSP